MHSAMCVTLHVICGCSLNVTKWVHLNYGDDGLRTLLRRMHQLLRRGGKLVLLAQAWSSYGRSKDLAQHLRNEYLKLTMRPKDILKHLLDDVGFSRLVAVRSVKKLMSSHTREILIVEK